MKYFVFLLSVLVIWLPGTAFSEGSPMVASPVTESGNASAGTRSSATSHVKILIKTAPVIDQKSNSETTGPGAGSEKTNKKIAPSPVKPE